MNPSLIWLAAILAALYADQNLLAPNLSAIATDLGLSEVERDVRLGGILNLVVTAVGAVAALVLGPLSDRVSRVRLLAGVTVVAELACVASAWAQTWPQLLFLRALTGIGLGAALPLALSLLGDLVPLSRRAFGASVLWTSAGAGIILGVAVAGQVGPVHGWRLPFLLVGLPNLAMAVAFACFVAEPRAGHENKAAHVDSAGGGPLLRRVLAVRTNQWLFIEGVFEVIPFAICATFLVDYLARERGFSVQQASTVLAAFGLAAIFGKLVAGRLGDRLFQRHPRWLPGVSSLALALAVLPAMAIFHIPGPEDGGRLLVPVLLISIVGFLAPMPKPLSAAVLLGVNSRFMRGAAFAGHRFSFHVGRGFGPLLASGLIVLFERKAAITLGLLCWPVAAILWLPVLRTFPRELKGNTPM